MIKIQLNCLLEVNNLLFKKKEKNRSFLKDIPEIRPFGRL